MAWEDDHSWLGNWVKRRIIWLSGCQGRKWVTLLKFSNKWLKHNEQHCTWTLPPGYKWAWRRGLIRMVETDATFAWGTEHWDIIKTVWFYHKDDHINFREWPRVILKKLQTSVKFLHITGIDLLERWRLSKMLLAQMVTHMERNSVTFLHHISKFWAIKLKYCIQ